MKTDSTYVTLPIMRGFTEIAPLWDLAQKHGSMICGGYARYCLSQLAKPCPAGDVDLFPQSEESSGALIAEIKALGFEVRHENEISVTFTRNEKHDIPQWRVCPSIQVILPVLQGAIVTVGDMREVLNNFDFTIVRAALISPTEGIADEDFLADDGDWKLRLKNIHCPVSSLMRCVKYSKKGYWLGVRESVKLFLDWNERGPEYQTKLVDLVNKMKGPNGEEPSKEDIEELEKLMNVD